MPSRITLLLLLAAAGCASSKPAPPTSLRDLAPLPRSSIVAVLTHRSDLQLTDDQVTTLEQADADLQQRLIRLRAEGGVPARSGGGLTGSLHGGLQPSEPGAGGQAVPGFGMNMGPGGFQLTPNGDGHGGTPRGDGTPGMGGAPQAEGARAHTPRRDPVKAQQELDDSLDQADTEAFLRAEKALTASQREGAREIASSYREQLFERRALLGGR